MDIGRGRVERRLAANQVKPFQRSRAVRHARGEIGPGRVLERLALAAHARFGAAHRGFQAGDLHEVHMGRRGLRVGCGGGEGVDVPAHARGVEGRHEIAEADADEREGDVEAEHDACDHVALRPRDQGADTLAVLKYGRRQGVVGGGRGRVARDGRAGKVEHRAAYGVRIQDAVQPRRFAPLDILGDGGRDLERLRLGLGVALEIADELVRDDEDQPHHAGDERAGERRRAPDADARQKPLFFALLAHVDIAHSRGAPPHPGSTTGKHLEFRETHALCSGRTID